MNKANVAALARIFEQDGVAPPHAHSIARSLAAAGVLAPSALTDEEAYDLGSLVDFTQTRRPETEAMEAKKVRLELERMAKAF